jgi:hypothetical protein
MQTYTKNKKKEKENKMKLITIKYLEKNNT